jgi:phosphate transport system permease protein
VTVSAPQAPLVLPAAISKARKAKDRAFWFGLRVAMVLALVPLVAIVAYVLLKGIPALNAALFTQTPAPYGQTGGGISEAFQGTILMVGMACLFSIPLGLLTAIYLSEFGRGALAGVVRFVAEILLSTPSIVAGAFIWSLVVVRTGSFSATAGAIALTVLMWPIITRATEDVLRLVPQDLREAGLALGLPRWKVVLRIVIPTAGAAIFTAIMLAVARGLGETAPILLTSLGNDFVNWNPMKPTDAVPLRLYKYAQMPFPYLHTIAWAGALVLLGAVLVLSISARILSRRQREKLG